MMVTFCMVKSMGRDVKFGQTIKNMMEIGLKTILMVSDYGLFLMDLRREENLLKVIE